MTGVVFSNVWSGNDLHLLLSIEAGATPLGGSFHYQVECVEATTPVCSMPLGGDGIATTGV